MQSQKQIILNMLLDSEWVCTSHRRLCDIKKDGYVLENRKCQQHDFHKGYSKEWRLIGVEPMTDAYVNELRKTPAIKGGIPMGVPFRVKEVWKDFDIPAKIKKCEISF